MNLNLMPGPTDAAKLLQLEQWRASEAISNVESLVPNKNFLHSLETAKNAYKLTVEKLAELLGEHAHCNWVDMDLWSNVSDLYKSMNGCRPRSFMTRNEASDWLKAYFRVM